MTGENSSLGERGRLIVNADDWGRDRQTTDRMLECLMCRGLSSVSAMVFMEDSERAAHLGHEHGVDSGLHLNFSLAYSSPQCPSKLREEQRKLVVYLTRHPLARVIFHPGLASAFEYVAKAQLEEFSRLYGSSPERIDGHHHLHLCANVVSGELLPKGTLVRRNFSFLPGEKSLINRLYRKSIDKKLARRHRLVDFLFPLAPLEPRARLERVSALARQHVVEVETHPINEPEFRFLTGEELMRWTGGRAIAPRFLLSDDREKVA